MPRIAPEGWVLDTRELRYLRGQANMKQKELAAAAGLSPSHLSNLERNAGSPPANSTIFRLAAALGVEVTDIAVWGDRRLLRGRVRVKASVEPLVDRLHPEVRGDAGRDWPVVPGVASRPMSTAS